MLLDRSVVSARLSDFERHSDSVAALGTERHAAVVIVLHEAAPGDTAIVLTKRTKGMRAHAGQWAIPGGRLEPGETPVQAALREMHEEVGVLAAESDVLGRSPLISWISRRMGYAADWSPESRVGVER